MRNIRKKMMAVLTALCLLVLAVPVYGSELKTDDRPVDFTIHEYDWTSYSIDYGDAKRQATGEQDPAWEGSMSKYALAEVEVTLIRIADKGTLMNISEDGQVSGVNVYKVDEEWRQLLFSGNEAMLAKTAYTSAELNEALAERKAALEEYVVEGHYTGPSRLLMTGADGTAHVTIPADEQGLYTIIETAVPENVDTTTEPFVVSLPMTKADGSGMNYDVHVYPKNQTSVPEVKKLVRADGDDRFMDSTTVSCGDHVAYNLVGKIPNVSSAATKLGEYEFLDHLPAGIECEIEQQNGRWVLKNPEQIEVGIYNSYEEACQPNGEPAVKLVYGVDYELEYIYDENGSSALRVSFTEEGLKKLNENDGKYVSVAYSAVVGSADKITAGDEGNYSDVTLSYGRSSTVGTGDVIVNQEILDGATVMTYGIEMQKKFSEELSDPALMQKVSFIVQDTTDGAYILAKRSEEGDGGNYEVTGRTMNREEATHLVPGTSGVVILDGLAAKIYKAEELETAEGFSVLKEPVVIEIIARKITTNPTTAVLAGQQQDVSEVGVENVQGYEQAKAFVNGEPAPVNTHGRVPRVELTVVNRKSFDNPIIDIIDHIIPKPDTGDHSSFVPYVIGIAAAAAVIIILVKRKNKED